MAPSPQRIVLGEVAAATATEVSFLSLREGLQMENHLMIAVSHYKIHTVQLLRSMGNGEGEREGKGTNWTGSEVFAQCLSLLGLSQSSHGHIPWAV